MSVPCASRWVAKECRKVCKDACRWIPQSRSAALNGSCTVDGETCQRCHWPLSSETRATLVRAIALGRRWLDQLAARAVPNPAAIASREGRSQRHVERTISLAFLAPDLVKAAIEGRLPRGVGVSRLFDPPSEWRRQWQMLGLPQ